MILEVCSPTEVSADALAELEPLMALSFWRPRAWPAELRWAYLDSPLGRGWWVNVRDEDGALLGHSGLMPLPPLSDARFDHVPVWYSLNTSVHPRATHPGLMVLALRALFRRVADAGPAIVLGVANANSVVGFTRLLGFGSPGRLALRAFPPGVLPHAAAPRAVQADETFLRWRVARPGDDMFCARDRGAILRRISHRGVPVDAVLTVDAPREWVTRLGLRNRPRHAWPFAPRLYATFGPGRHPGLRVPERLRPSALHYIARSLAPGVDAATLLAFCAERRFEFLDFDVL